MIGRQSQKVDDLDDRLRDNWRSAMAARQNALDAAAARLSSLDLRLRFAEIRRRLEACDTAIGQAVRLRLSHAQGELMALEAHLKQLSPLAILDRGYAIVEREGKIVKSPEDAPVGSEIQVRLAKGGVSAVVTAITPADSSELPS